MFGVEKEDQDEEEEEGEEEGLSESKEDEDDQSYEKLGMSALSIIILEQEKKQNKLDQKPPITEDTPKPPSFQKPNIF